MIHSWSWTFFGCRNFCYAAEISASKSHFCQKRFFHFFSTLCRNFYTCRNFWQKFLQPERHHVMKFSFFFFFEKIGHFHRFRVIWIRPINVFFLGGVIFTYPNWHWRAEMRAGSKICLSTKLYIIFLWRPMFVKFLWVTWVFTRIWKIFQNSKNANFSTHSKLFWRLEGQRARAKKNFIKIWASTRVPNRCQKSFDNSY